MSTVTEHTKKSKSILEVLEFCQELNLPARVVGKWVWIQFTEKPAADVRQSLKDFGFRWSHRRQQWSHNCGNRCTKPARGYRPWDKYQTTLLDDYMASRTAVAI